MRFDDGSRALYATDSSNYRQVPIGVVVPRDASDVEAAIAVCRRHAAPIVSRGAGTSLAGQACNTAVVLDMSKHMNQIIELDPERRIARVQPGLVLDDLRAAAGVHNLTVGPDPATHNRCTLGGMIGNNSCGVHSITSGKMDQNVEELEVLTYGGLRLKVGATSDEERRRIVADGGEQGEMYGRLEGLRDRYGGLIAERYPDIPRRVSGYNLDCLLPERDFHLARALVGSEGTCVTVLEATVRLVESPPARALLVLGYSDIFAACDDVPLILQSQPNGLEGFDDSLIAGMRKKRLRLREIAMLPSGNGWLLVEFGGQTRAEAEARARGLVAQLRQRLHGPAIKLVLEPSEQHGIWDVRESALGATAVVPGEPYTWPGWEDAAVPPDRLGHYLRDFQALIERFDYNAAFYGHFGEGCMHTRVNFDFRSPAGRAAFRSFIEQSADLVVQYGGSLSGEHGDGQARGELLEKMFGPELVQAFREFKAIWDPDNKMNPGKVVNARPLDGDLRLATFQPPTVRTNFSYTAEGGFDNAVLRCVGVGKCRRHEAGTMCPSYMVTREEMHSTRGRARLLVEMLQGDTVRDGWKSRAVKESLDLCLACKGCKSECPTQVDMATYKAEFLSHYYAGRFRPRTAYALGWIYWWARLASRVPGPVNWLLRNPLSGRLAKTLAGISPNRRIPTFAQESFTAWMRRREPTSGSPVLLWPDTFNNYFHPEVAQAAVEVLEAAGYQVTIPDRPLCCGRPLYDYGFLGLARRLLTQIMNSIEPQIAAGVPLIGLEPSCVAVFRDELLALFPHDERARRLSGQSFLLSEFLEQQGYQPPALKGRALVHGHCHHKAVMEMDAEIAVLQRLGLEANVLDAGCCGMAGAFGFEQEHYEVSMACGERVLLPAVREASDDTLIITDGFSCREQISQSVHRSPLHLAQVLQKALAASPLTPQSPP